MTNELNKIIKIYKNIWKDDLNIFNEDFSLINIENEPEFITTWCSISELKEIDSNLYNKNVENSIIYSVKMRYREDLFIDEIVIYNHSKFLIKKIDYDFEKRYTTLNIIKI